MKPRGTNSHRATKRSEDKLSRREFSKQLTTLNHNPTFQTFVQEFNQSGGLDLSTLVNQTSGLIQQGISTAQTINTQAEKFSNQFNQLSTQVNKLSDTVSKQIPIDLNYTSPTFSQSSPTVNGIQKFQTYGNSVCISKEFLSDLRLLLNEIFSTRNEVPS